MTPCGRYTSEETRSIFKPWLLLSGALGRAARYPSAWNPGHKSQR